MSNVGDGINIAKGAKDEIDRMDPLPDRKNPWVAAVDHSFFGAIGVGLYFGSWSDFFLCFVVIFLLLMTGIGAPLGFVLTGVYGYYRAHTSNEKGYG